MEGKAVSDKYEVIVVKEPRSIYDAGEHWTATVQVGSDVYLSHSFHGGNAQQALAGLAVYWAQQGADQQ